MKFHENNFGVGKYYNFIPKDINETYRLLIERGVKVYEKTPKKYQKFSFACLTSYRKTDGNPIDMRKRRFLIF